MRIPHTILVTASYTVHTNIVCVQGIDSYLPMRSTIYKFSILQSGSLVFGYLFKRYFNIHIGKSADVRVRAAEALIPSYGLNSLK